ncbi:MAG: hypothetical protein AAFO03_18720, partial [Bacteroidota bacterium]
MKMLVKGLAFASLFLCLTQAQATNFPPADGNLLLKVSQVDDEVLLLQIANMQQEATTVSLVDLDGNTFFRKQVTKHNGYAWKMNLQDAPDGRYILRVMQKDEQRSQVIYKSDDQILL